VEFDCILFFLFFGQFSNFLNHKIEKKNTPNLWCHRISISCDNLFQIGKREFWGFLVTQISKEKNQLKIQQI
jgi:hypothetical protein